MQQRVPSRQKAFGLLAPLTRVHCFLALERKSQIWKAYIATKVAQHFVCGYVAAVCVCVWGGIL